MAAVTLANASDAFAKSTTLLAPFDGSFTSLTGEVWSTNSGAPSATPPAAAIGPFANGTLDLRGGGSLVTPHSTALALHSGATTFDAGDFTLEFWIKSWDGETAPQDVLYKGNGTQSDFRVYRHYVGGYFMLRLELGDNPLRSTSIWTGYNNSLSWGAWKHVAFVVSHSTGTARVYVNGTFISQQALSVNDRALSQSGSNLPLYLGVNPLNAVGHYGFISDVRITKAVRYNGHFSLPTAMSSLRAGGATARAVASLSAATGCKLSVYVDEHADKVSVMHHFDGAGMDPTCVDTTGKVWTLAKDFGTGPGLAPGLTHVGLSRTDTVWDSASQGVVSGPGYLSSPHHPSMSLADGSSFTIEAWVYPTTVTGYNQPASTLFAKDWDSNTENYSYRFHISSSRYLVFQSRNNGMGADGLISGGQVALYTWTHVAVSYDAATTTFMLFIDGVPSASKLAATIDVEGYAGISDLGGNAFVGGLPYWDAYKCFNGMIEELRFTKGVARYTDAFPPPMLRFGNTVGMRTSTTAALTAEALVDKLLDAQAQTQATCGATLFIGAGVAISLAAAPACAPFVSAGAKVDITFSNLAVTDPYLSNVASQMHFEGADGAEVFTDQSGKAWGVVAEGNHPVTSNLTAKFGATSLRFYRSGIYDNPTVTQELWSSAPSADFDFLSGDFTVEFWANQTSGNTTPQTVIQFNSLLGGRGWGFGGAMSLAINFGLFEGGVQPAFFGMDASLYDLGGNYVYAHFPLASGLVGEWVHVALTRQGNILYGFCNGALTYSYDIGPVSLAAGMRHVGLGGTTLNGFIDELRITKGVARYTAAFERPKVAFSDSALGPAGAQSFASAALATFANYALVSAPSVSSALTSALVVKHFLASSAAASAQTSANLLALLPAQKQVASAAFATASAVPALKVNVRLAASAGAVFVANANPAGPQGVVLAGNDPHFSNVVVLLHLDGTDGSTQFVDQIGHTVVVEGSAHLSAGQTVSGTASFSPLSGTSDRITVSSPDLLTGASDFTLEFWYKPSPTGFYSNTVSPTALVGFAGNNGVVGLMLQVLAANGDTGALTLNVFEGGGAPVLASTISGYANTWNHVAICRAGSRLYTMVNGRQDYAYVMVTAGFSGTSATLAIANAVNPISFPYAIDEVRVTKGVSRYPYLDKFAPQTRFPDVVGPGPLSISAQATVTAGLSTDRSVSAQALCSASMTAALAGPVRLAAAAGAIQTVSARLAEPVVLAAAAGATQTASAALASLRNEVALGASAKASSVFTVAMAGDVFLSAAAAARASGTANVREVTQSLRRLASQPAAQAKATASLKATGYITLGTAAVSSPAVGAVAGVSKGLVSATGAARAAATAAVKVSRWCGAQAIARSTASSSMSLRVTMGAPCYVTHTLSPALLPRRSCRTAAVAAAHMTSAVRTSKQLAAQAVTDASHTARMLTGAQHTDLLVAPRPRRVTVAARLSAPARQQGATVRVTLP